MIPVATLGLIGLNLIGVAGLVGLWLTPEGQLRNVRWEVPAQVRPSFASVNVATLNTAHSATASFVAALDRPVFSPTRRPPPAKPVEAAPDPLANIQLMGIYGTSSGGGILARIDGKSRRVGVQEQIGPWTLSKIEDRTVTLVRNDESRTLVLEKAKPRPQALPPVFGANTQPDQAAPPPPGAPTANVSESQRLQDDARERLARRNAARAKLGLAPVAD